jgi:hypothetical protein
VSACRSCGAPILWAETDGGKRAPLDLDPVPDGTFVIADRNRWGTPRVAYVPADALLIDDAPRYRSHYATCPDADRWRRR